MEIIKVNISQLRIHPENASLLPPLSPEDEQRLQESLEAGLKPIPLEGLQSGIQEYLAIDGNNRLRILNKIGYTGELLVVILGSVEDWPIEKQRTAIQTINLSRRHLSREQKQEIARQMVARGEGIVEVAKVIGVSKDTVARATQDVQDTRKDAVKETIKDLFDLGLSQREIAKTVGVSLGTVSNISQMRKTEQPEPVILDRNGVVIVPADKAERRANAMALIMSKADEKTILARTEENLRREKERKKARKEAVAAEIQKVTGENKFQLLYKHSTRDHPAKEEINSLLTDNSVIVVFCFDWELVAELEWIKAVGYTYRNALGFVQGSTTDYWGGIWSNMLLFAVKGKVRTKQIPIAILEISSRFADNKLIYQYLEKLFPDLSRMLNLSENGTAFSDKWTILPPKKYEEDVASKEA